MLIEKVLPRAVPQLGCSSTRADDVGKKYGCEHTVKIRFILSPPASQELFNLSEDRLRVSDPWIMVRSEELTYLADLMFRARYRPFSTLITSPERCRTSVGTLIVEST
jgi:hypothetical protein